MMEEHKTATGAPMPGQKTSGSDQEMREMRDLGYAMEGGAACYLFRRGTSRKVTPESTFRATNEQIWTVHFTAITRI
jgi:hypothetical protein